jgi:hypothetical protein
LSLMRCHFFSGLIIAGHCIECQTLPCLHECNILNFRVIQRSVWSSILMRSIQHLLLTLFHFILTNLLTKLFHDDIKCLKWDTINIDRIGTFSSNMFTYDLGTKCKLKEWCNYNLC